MRMEEAAPGIDCQETKLDKAFEEIIEKIESGHGCEKPER